MLEKKEDCDSGFDSLDEAIKRVIDIAGAAKKRSSQISGIATHIQLMTCDLKYTSEYHIQEINAELKALAKELNIPIIALSQLSHQVENRIDKRPKLLDLGGFGSIEQDTDIVLFVYREEYYLKNEEPQLGTLEHQKWQDEMEKIMGKADVIFAKQRHGPTGIVSLAFQSSFTRFSDLEDIDYLPEKIG